MAEITWNIPASDGMMKRGRKVVEHRATSNQSRTVLGRFAVALCLLPHVGSYVNLCAFAPNFKVGCA